ncbi:MAG: penicillin-binding protein 2 [Deltaproteobacteria bacterium]|nr:penicillin-binding protein 2 [Deltaproteobacteria bacterium]
MRSSGFDPVLAETLNRRFRTVTALVVVIIAGLLLRLWFLQVVNGPAYRTQSENNRIHLQKIPPFRGMIFDRNGDLLVDNRPSYDLYIVPEDIQDHDQFLESLNLLTGLDPERVERKLKKAPKGYPFRPILIKKNISRNELAVVETNMFNLPGVMIQVKPQRNYLFGRLASHLIGYLGEISQQQLKSGRHPESRPGDPIGKYGVEEVWQNSLSGLRGGKQVEVDAAGRKLRVLSSKPPVPGLNIFLTIDKDLQLLAEKLLGKKKGAIVALNPGNGEIDPNMFVGGIDKTEWGNLASSRDFPLQNRAVSGQYPPGSVFKIVMAVAGLEEGIIDPEEEIVCPGSYKLGTHTYRCWKKHGHGKVNFHKALRESCDVYFYKVGKRLGVDRIAYYAKMCGLGEKTNFELSYEKEGLIPTSKWKLKRWGVPWQQGETISVSIGQSFVLVTPLQQARLIAVIFNGGRIYQPKVIRSVGKEGEEVYRFAPTLIGTMDVEQESLDLIKNALIGVVNEPHGTGSRSRVKGVTVAGKTGTAQVITLEAEKALGAEGEIPDEFRDHAWFVAIAPVEDPKIALAILVENGGHGGSAAAPMAGKMIKAYLNLDQ